jgi:NLI interacting factor-like phosphatase
MKLSTTEEICLYLSEGFKFPNFVFGQNSCTSLKCKESSGYLATFKEPGTNKEIFLKDLSHVFNAQRGKFTPANTIIVDDSPIKHILNKPENVVLPDTWTHKGNGPKDTFLLDFLLP